MVSPNKRAFILFLFCFAGCTNDRKADWPETKRRGNTVIKALNQYKSDQGQYPKTLDDLRPKYLSEIPEPTWGLKTWIYTPKATEFELQVNETIHTGDGDSLWFRYMGEKIGWQGGD